MKIFGPQCNQQIREIRVHFCSHSGARQILVNLYHEHKTVVQEGFVVGVEGERCGCRVEEVVEVFDFLFSPARKLENCCLRLKRKRRIVCANGRG